MKVRIDLKILIFIILFYFTHQLKIYLIVMLFAFIHELGHLIAGLILGIKPEKIDLMPFGATITFKPQIQNSDYENTASTTNRAQEYIKKIIVLIAGPLTNFIIILITSNIDISIFTAMIIIYTNLILLLFNMFPIYPLDGGRIIQETLNIIFGKTKSKKYTKIVSKIFLTILTILAIITFFYCKNIAPIIIVMYLCSINKWQY